MVLTSFVSSRKARYVCGSTGLVFNSATLANWRLLRLDTAGGETASSAQGHLDTTSLVI